MSDDKAIMSAADKVRAEFAAKLADAETEDAIAIKVPAEQRRFIHVHKLYGTVASVRYGEHSLRRDEACDFDRALELVKALPPIARSQIRTSCLSFPPRDYVEGLPEAKKIKWKEERDISPVIFHIEGFQGPNASLEWYTQISGVGAVEIKVCLSQEWQRVVQYSAERVDFRGGFKYNRPLLNIVPDARTVIADEGHAVAQLEHPIYWASGGSEYPSRVTLYWCDLVYNANPAKQGEAILAHLARIADKEVKS